MPEEQILGEIMPEGGREKEGDGTITFKDSAAEIPSVETEIPKEKNEGKYDELLVKVTSNQVTKAVADDESGLPLDAKNIGETADEDSKIQKLLHLAETKNVAYAVKVARSLRDYYALDRMHDELADKFYEALVAKGLVDED